MQSLRAFTCSENLLGEALIASRYIFWEHRVIFSLQKEIEKLVWPDMKMKAGRPSTRGLFLLKDRYLRVCLFDYQSAIFFAQIVYPSLFPLKFEATLFENFM